MENQIDYLFNLDVNEKVIYIFICIIILYFCHTILHVELYHILAFFLVIFVIYTLSYVSNKQLVNENNDIDYKLNSLLDFSANHLDPYLHNYSSFPEIDFYNYNDAPEYMYLDANLIKLFYDIKNAFFDYSPEAYTKALTNANNLLRIRYDFERIVESEPDIPFMLDNYLKSYKIKHSQKKNNTLINAYENYQVADEDVKMCLNNLQSFIIVIPSEPILHLKHQEMMVQTEILLRRNLDIIYQIYKSRKLDYDTIITDYDNVKPMSSFTGQDQLETTFNFY